MPIKVRTFGIPQIRNLYGKGRILQKLAYATMHE